MKTLTDRAGNACEISGATENLVPVSVGPDDSADHHVLLAQTLADQVNGTTDYVPNDWRGLNDAIWSETPAVQVLAYRTLHHLRTAGWPRDLLDMMYLEDDTLAWAKAGLPDENAVVHQDANGHVLSAGDSVVLIKDLKVKGGGFTAKRGTAVRNIRLVPDHAGQIEGRVENQQVVLLTEYVKKKG